VSLLAVVSDAVVFLELFGVLAVLDRVLDAVWGLVLSCKAELD
jgi:hypothetical protein